MNYIQLLKKSPKPLLFATVCCFFSFTGQSHFLALFSPYFIEKLQISNQAYGAIYSLATLASAFLLPVVGPLIDKVDLRTYCKFVISGLLAGFACVFYSNYIAIAFLGLFLLRLNGQALCGHIGNVSTARYFDRERGKALSIINTGFPIAEGLLTPLMAFIVVNTYYSYHNSLIIAVGLVIALFMPISQKLTKDISEFNLPKRSTLKEDSTNSPDKSWNVKEVLKDPTFFMMIPFLLFPAFSLTGFLIYQKYFTEIKMWPNDLISIALTTFAIGRFGFSFITGPLIDKYSAYKLFPFFQIPLTLGFWLFYVAESQTTIYISMMLFGLTVGAAGPIKASIWPELYGTKHLGAIKSVYASLAVFSTAASSFLFGIFVDKDYASSITYWLIVSHIMCTALAFACVKIKKIA